MKAVDLHRLRLAPPWDVETWLNSDRSMQLEDLRGKVVMIKAFQMLCPGCVSHALPQATRVHRLFDPNDVVVIGLHAVFEHHQAQGGRVALEAFLHEYRLMFPVAIDKPSASGTPVTMAAYGMRGTPTTILIDRHGRLRTQIFGQFDDIRLGADISALIHESVPLPASDRDVPSDEQDDCSPNGCAKSTG